jgi:hypothetical protein
VDIRKAIAWLRRELSDLERMIASVEDNIAASRDKQSTAASPKTARDLIARLHPPFQEPDFGLWLREDH